MISRVVLNIVLGVWRHNPELKGSRETKMSSQYFEDLEDEIKQLIEDAGRLLDVTLPKLRGGKTSYQLSHVLLQFRYYEAILAEGILRLGHYSVVI